MLKFLSFWRAFVAANFLDTNPVLIRNADPVPERKKIEDKSEAEKRSNLLR
jgi:hypothetical protein